MTSNKHCIFLEKVKPMNQDTNLRNGLSENQAEQTSIGVKQDVLNAVADMRPKEEVFLRIYDLSNGMAKLISPQLLGFQIDGVWHTSIEIFGNEYYFHNGLNVQKVGATPFRKCVERMSLGFTDCTHTSLVEFLECGKGSWGPESYDLFENNCNDFSNWLANFLVERNIPNHILELPKKVKDTAFFKIVMNRRM